MVKYCKGEKTMEKQWFNKSVEEVKQELIIRINEYFTEIEN